MNISSADKFLIITLSFIVAIGFGLSYGNVNHNTYLLDGLIKINPEFITGDWLGHQTQHYHNQFSIILVMLDKIGLPLDYGLAAIEMILRIIAIIIIYKLINIFAKINLAPIFLLTLALLVIEETRSLGSSYILSRNLQPSSFGAVFGLIALYQFIKGKYFVSGIMMAIAGYMHTNFLLLGFIYLGLAHVFLGYKDIIRRGTLQFSPMLIVLALELPFLLSMASNSNGELANYIFQFIRAPGHYVPEVFIWDFMTFTAWAILGFIGLNSLNLDVNLKLRISSIFYSLIFILIACSLLTSTIIFIPKISQFFPWRFAPYFTLLCQILFITYLINNTGDNKNENKLLILSKYFAYLIACLLILRYYAYEHGITAVNSLILILLLGFLGLILSIRVINIYNIKFKFFDVVTSHYKTIGYSILILSLAFHYNDRFLSLSNMVSNYPPAYEAELFEWTKTSPQGSIFLAPLELDNLRIHGERATIVDWRSTPIHPDGLIEWYGRVQSISGIDDINIVENTNTGYTIMNNAHAGYHSMDMEKLKSLHTQYEFDYAIIDKTKNSLFDNLDKEFENSRYIILKM